MFIKKNLHLGQHLFDYELYQFECPFFGWGRDLKKNSGVSTDTFIFVKKAKESWFYFNLPEWKRVGKRYFQIIYKNPSQLIRVLDRIIAESRNVYDHSAKIPSAKKLSQLSDKDLYWWYKKFHEHHHAYWNLAMTPNLLEAENSYLTDYVMGLVVKNKKNFQTTLPIFEVFNKLMIFENKSFLEKRNDDYLRLLIKLRASSQKNKLIDSFYKKYCWLEYNWAGPAEDKEVLVKTIQSDLVKKIDYKKKLAEVVDTRKNDLKLKKKFLAEMKISRQEKTLLVTLEKLYFSKNYRMDCSYFSYYHLERVLKEIGRRLYLSLNQVRSIFPDEMSKHLIQKKFDAHRLNKLYNHSVLFWDGKKSKLLLDDEATRFINSMSEKDYIQGKKINTLKGQIAFQGTAKGKCRIINHRSELDKIKKGEIMISDFTDPSLMPAILKASAIVTNFGGMTCHAAIVSRELKMPCIIGTKIATKVFKDGDRVEVDAFRGIIRKI